MALTRKFLSALGIEADKVDEIIQAHTEVTDSLKEERDKYKEDAEKLPSIQKELDELKSKEDGVDPYQEKFEKLEKEFNDYKADIEAKNTTAKKENVLRAILKEIGIPDKRIDSVIKVSDISKIDFDDEGNLKEADALKDNLKSEWSDFITTTKTEGANSANPPSNVGKTTMTKDQIRAIPDAAARQKAMLENPSLFGLPENNE